MAHRAGQEKGEKHTQGVVQAQQRREVAIHIPALHVVATATGPVGMAGSHIHAPTTRGWGQFSHTLRIPAVRRSWLSGNGL